MALELWWKCQSSQLKLWTHNIRRCYRPSRSCKEFSEKDENQSNFNSKCVNEVKLLGHVGQNPKKYEMGSNLIVYFSLATTRYYHDKSDMKQNYTTWHSIVVRKPTLQDYVIKYISKGMRAYISGYIDCKNLDFNDEQTKGIVHVVADEVIYFKKSYSSQSEDSIFRHA